MRFSRSFVFAALAALSVAVALPASAQTTVVVPAGLANTEGSTNITTPLNTDARTLQQRFGTGVDIDNVEGLTPGTVITGFALRLNNATTGTPPAFSFSDYEVYLGQATASLTTTFANNFVAGTRIQVRDGGLAFAAGAFTTDAPAGGTTPEAFGPDITFGTFSSSGTLSSASTFIYTGGPLLLEIRHSGNGTANSFPADADSSSALSFNFVAGQTATAGDNVTTSTGLVVRFTTASVAAPEPASFALLALPFAVGIVASRRRNAKR